MSTYPRFSNVYANRYNMRSDINSYIKLHCDKHLPSLPKTTETLWTTEQFIQLARVIEQLRYYTRVYGIHYTVTLDALALEVKMQINYTSITAIVPIDGTGRYWIYPQYIYDFYLDIHQKLSTII